MFLQNFRLALISISRNKLRSILTMLGMIIGIGAVVTVISIGDGLKAQVKKEFDALGINLITISPQPEGEPLTQSDVETVRSNELIQQVAPTTYVDAVPSNGQKKDDTAIINATPPRMSDIIGQKVQNGRFFNDGEKDVVVIGANVATTLFGQENPVGKKLLLKQEFTDINTSEPKVIQQEFTVIGNYEKLSEKTSIGPGAQLDTTLYIPFENANTFSDNKIFIDEISAQAKTSDQLGQAKTSLTAALKAKHKDKEDFTIQSSEDVSKSFDEILNVVTNFITAIAAISLLVGGIGIMNIMLTSVTERTREIGIRKSIGASQIAIMTQFLTEAMVLTMMGGLFGIIVAYLLSFAVKAFADITPVFTIRAFVVAVGISAIIGVVFGSAPALQAARKKPIDALRHE
jgi:putative ABC transport system permease protein